MRIPGPDQAAVALMDRAIAVPQRRGVPMAAVQAALEIAAPLGGAGVGAATVAVGLWPIALPWLAFVAFLAVHARRQAGLMLNDARAWSPGLALRYRAEALHHRETFGGLRLGLVGLGALLGLACGLSAAAAGPFAATVPFWLALLGLDIVLALRLYAYCALPRDPDVPARLAPRPA